MGGGSRASGSSYDRHPLRKGGSPDDRAYAAAAAGLAPGALDSAALALALESLRATDRFSDVAHRWELLPGGRHLRVLLTPWQPLTHWTWEGDPLDAKQQRLLFTEVRKGARPGALRMEAMRYRAEQKLRETGHPEAKVTLSRIEAAGRLVIRIQLGRPARIARVEWDGNAAPYSREALLAAAGILPGRSLWSQTLRREALAGLRKRFLADHRYEWQAELSWKEDGILRARVNPGPRVQIAFEGDRIRWTGVKDLLPFVWADRYSADLLDQGDRRILLFLNSEGYKDAQVSCRSSVRWVKPTARQSTPVCPGKLFGEFAFIDGQPRSATAVAIQKSTVFKIPSADIYAIFDQDAKMGYITMRNLARILARRIRQTAHKLRSSLMWERH